MKKLIPCLVVLAIISLVGLAPAGAQPSSMAPVAPAPAVRPVAAPAPAMAVLPAPMAPAASAVKPTAPAATDPMTAPVATPPVPPVAEPVPTMAATDGMGGEVPAPMAPEASTGPANPNTTTTTTTSTSKADPWWKVLLGGLTTTALTFLSFMLLGIGGIFLKWLMSKMKIEDAATVQKVEELYDMAITLGVDYARQMARKLSDDPDANGKKVQWAMDMIQKLITEWKLPQKTADWVKGRIEAKLGEERKVI